MMIADDLLMDSFKAHSRQVSVGESLANSKSLPQKGREPIGKYWSDIYLERSAWASSFAYKHISNELVSL